MDDEAAAYLADMIGSDIAALHNEIEKLVLYVGEAPSITPEDCRAICSRSAETLSWEFSGALAEKNAARALELIPGIIDSMLQEKGASGRPEMAIIYAVNSEFKRILSLQCEGKKFHIPPDAPADFFYRLSDENKGTSDSPLFSMHPFYAFKTWQRARNFTGKELAEAFRAILNANLALVTGSGDARLAL